MSEAIEEYEAISPPDMKHELMKKFIKMQSEKIDALYELIQEDDDSSMARYLTLRADVEILMTENKRLYDKLNRIREAMNDDDM